MISEPTVSDYRYWPDKIMTVYKKQPPIVNGHKDDSGSGRSVGIETGYGLDGTGIESLWRRDIPHLSRPAQGPTQPPV